MKGGEVALKRLKTAGKQPLPIKLSHVGEFDHDRLPGRSHRGEADLADAFDFEKPPDLFFKKRGIIRQDLMQIIVIEAIRRLLSIWVLFAIFPPTLLSARFIAADHRHDISIRGGTGDKPCPDQNSDHEPGTGIFLSYPRTAVFHLPFGPGAQPIWVTDLEDFKCTLGYGCVSVLESAQLFHLGECTSAEDSHSGCFLCLEITPEALK